jgi:hypothetical protein
MKEIQVERALRISGVLLILGIVVEIISLLWEKPLAFSCSSVSEVLSLLQVSFSIFTLCCHRLSNLRRNPGRKTHSSAKLLIQLPAIGVGGSYLRGSGQRPVRHRASNDLRKITVELQATAQRMNARGTL